MQVLLKGFYLINMTFGHHIPRIVWYSAMTFLRHPSRSSGFIQDFLEHYTLEWQKAVSAYLVSELILHYAVLKMQVTISAYF